MLTKHSISIRGHKTSYSLEDEFYQELKRIAKEQDVPLARLITKLDSKRQHGTNLSSALRLFVLREVKGNP